MNVTSFDMLRFKRGMKAAGQSFDALAREFQLAVNKSGGHPFAAIKLGNLAMQHYGDAVGNAWKLGTIVSVDIAEFDFVFSVDSVLFGQAPLRLMTIASHTHPSQLLVLGNAMPKVLDVVADFLKQTGELSHPMTIMVYAVIGHMKHEHYRVSAVEHTPGTLQAKFTLVTPDGFESVELTVDLDVIVRDCTYLATNSPPTEEAPQ